MRFFVCVPLHGAGALQGTGVLSEARGSSTSHGCPQLGTVALLKPCLAPAWVRGGDAVGKAAG